MRSMISSLIAGIDEQAIVVSVDKGKSPNLKEGDVIIRIDERYFRPSEVDTLLGDPSYARSKLGWSPEITARKLCTEMIEADVKTAKENALLLRIDL